MRAYLQDFGKFTLCLSLVMGVVALASCGQQQGPSLASDRAQQLRGESETLTAKSLTASRSSSDESGEAAAPTQMSVFSRRMEPLTLQRGGSVRVAVPLSDYVVSAGLVREIQFQATGEGLSASVVAGRSLNLVVGEDSAEGKYDGKVVVKLSNGREAVQSISVTVIP